MSLELLLTGFEFIKNIFSEFQNQASIAIVLHEEQPISAQLHFTFKETVILVWLVTPNEYQNLGTNYFLMSRLLKKFYEEGINIWILDEVFYRKEFMIIKKVGVQYKKNYIISIMLLIKINSLTTAEAILKGINSVNSGTSFHVL